MHPALDLCLGRFAQLEAKGHVVIDTHMGIQRIALEHHGDVAIFGRHVVHNAVADLDRPGSDLFQAGQQAQGGGLAAAGGSNQYEEFLVGDVQ